MIIFKADLKYISDSSTLLMPDETTDATINELLNDIEKSDKKEKK